MRELQPILDKDRYSEAVYKELDYYFYTLIFQPLIEILKETIDIKINAKASLLAAFRAGRIQYHDGYITGQFNAAVSRDIRSFGGTWNKVKKAFKIDLSKLPTDIKIAIQHSREKERETIERIERALNQVEIARKSIEGYPVRFTDQLGPVFGDLDQQFKKTTKEVLTVAPETGKEFRARMEETYNRNINLSIQKWTDDAVLALREKVTKNVDAGFRSDRLAEMIRSEYAVSKNKAKFLARQETSLLVSAYRKDRYEDAGIQRYRWSSSHDRRVREDHAKLSGKIFTWDNPPITDSVTGARNHPGQDFNCRCVAIPILTLS